jgi:hypothetical protein
VVDPAGRVRRIADAFRPGIMAPGAM